jgi:hypothetical protein
MIALLLATALAADCDAPTEAHDVRDALDAAYRKLENLDIGGFKAATDDLDAVLPCLTEALPPPVIAEVHRTKGIRAFGERDTEQAQHMFAAARTIEPGYRFPYNLIPDGNPIRSAYMAVDTGLAPTTELPDPASGDLRVDGYSSRSRSAAWPSLVQYLKADGTVQFTAYLLPDEPVPDYPLVGEVAVPKPVVVAPVPMPSTVPAPVPSPVPVTPTKSSAKVPLLVAASVAAVGSGVAYGMAGAGHARFYDTATPDAELDGLRGRTNTLVIVGGFGGAASLGLLVAGLTSK